MANDVTLFAAVKRLQSSGFAVQENLSLREKLTLKLSASADFLITLKSLSDFSLLADALGKDLNKFPILFLGGGSNLVLTQDFHGLVIEIQYQGRSLIPQDDHVIAQVGAGESWSETVDWACGQGLWGIENFALIPGSVGAAPIQNIGAYGCELKDSFDHLKALHLPTGKWHSFDKDACQFAYRESFFKTSVGRQYLIAEVGLKLSKNPKPNLKYPDLQKHFQSHTPQTSQEVAEAVKAIRKAKLPDPKVLGNVGSFFKNPVISQAAFEKLRKQHPEMTFYQQSNGDVKVPAAWLIDRAGWKGFRRGQVGVHEKQALVLVNFGNASGAEIMTLATDIQKDVFNKYEIELEVEPTSI